MIKVSKPLSTHRLTPDELKNVSILNTGVTLDELNKKFSKTWDKNQAKRMKAQRKY